MAPDQPTTYPLFHKLDGRPVVVIGGGGVAARRVNRLVDAGATITVVSPRLDPVLDALRRAGRIRWTARTFEPQDLDGQALAFLAAGDPELVPVVKREAEQRGIPLNTAEDEKSCDFHVPALVESQGVQIAISSQGASPGRVKRLREMLEEWLSRQELGDLAEEGRRRQEVRRALADRPRERLDALRRLSCSGTRPGKVHLVGAGPGDPGLLTVRGLQVLLEADVVFYDRLVSKAILDAIPSATGRIYVGKEVGCAHRANISELMVAAARAGKRVARLKGGDPILYGRGGEEMLDLERAGVEYEVVPGVSALCSVPAAAGIPVTYRGLASEVVVRSGHRAGKRSPPGRRAAAGSETTHVYFMAVARVEQVVNELLDEGVHPSTPAAVVQNGTLPEQRVVVGELREMATLVRENHLEPPGLMIVGHVVKFRNVEEFLALIGVKTARPPLAELTPLESPTRSSNEQARH